MGKDYKALAQSIVKELGGSENITKIFHCATRLRVQLKDMDVVNLEAIKRMEGVLGALVSAGGVQVIIGNDVAKVYEQAITLYDLESTAVSPKNIKDDEKIPVFSKLLNVLSAIMGPAIPLIMVSGLISAVLVLLTKAGLDPESSTSTILTMVSKAALYFLPVLLAYTSAKKFGTDIMTSVFLGAIMVSPTLIGLGEAGSYVTLFGLPVKIVDYTSSLIPIILTIWIYSYVEKLVEKIVPSAVKFVFRPFCNVVIMIPVMLCVTGPIGSYMGDIVLNIMTGINNVAPWASVLVVGGLAPLLVLTGMHIALIPIVITSFSTVGFDAMLFVAFIGMNFSQFGVAMACLFKTKNANLKTLASSCAITSFLAGVTEPTLYGICVRMKKPLIATWIACIANAVFCAIFSVKVYNFGAPSFFTMPIFLNPDGTMSNLYFAIAATVLTIIVSFVATWVIGFDDSVYGSKVTE